MKAHEAISEGLLLFSAVVLAAMLPQAGPVQPATPPSAVPQAAPALIPTTFVPISATIAPVRDASRSRKVQTAPDTHVRRIVVSLPDRRLALLEDGQVMQVYTVAVGKASTPSPTGTFTILDRVSNPTYYHDGKVVPPGPANPVGDRWMSLSKAGYGIHGTNAPRSIGHAASHGCIRMARPDLEKLFVAVRTGDTVEIIGERNAETASLFGAPAAPSTTTTVLAQSGQSTESTMAAAVPAGQ
ncbi:MAG TPA: L,D-transpeptidase [Acidobacteriaceae bacterium]|nr:L,D-transpeptidase [Acidobacteriaceae bacterium]